MRPRTSASFSRIAALALSCALGLSLSACGGVPTNRSMYSVHQPVVEKAEYALDLNTNSSGLGYGEQNRLNGWFNAMGLKYGDRVLIEDPADIQEIRDAITATAARYNAAVAPAGTVLANDLPSGMVRVTITRATAHVPGCPDWSAKSDANPNNALSSNFGCAVNGNLAAMIADPEDLVQGAKDTGSTGVMTSNKAIEAYRKAEPTGMGNKVKEVSSQDQGSN